MIRSFTQEELRTIEAVSDAREMRASGVPELSSNPKIRSDQIDDLARREVQPEREGD